MARKNAVALVLTYMAGSSEAASHLVRQGKEMVVAVVNEPVIDWWWTMVFTLLLIYAAVWMAHIMKSWSVVKRPDNDSQYSQPAQQPSTCMMMMQAQTQSQVTYTSVRHAAQPRFHVLTDREQGVWRDGMKQ